MQIGGKLMPNRNPRIRPITFRRALLAAVLVLAPGMAAPAFAANTAPTPANKAAASGRKAVVIAPQTNVELLSVVMKTSKPTDLILQVSLECTIFTRLVTGGSAMPGPTDTSSAHGFVRVWVTLDNEIVRIQDASMPPQNPSVPQGDDSDKVTFCDREYSRTVSDEENPMDGLDKTDDYIRTKSTHAFNWLRLNTGSGVHTIRVMADLDATAAGQPDTTAEAIVGNRTLIIEPTKTAVNAVIQ
jgi:hypothetical protein